MIFLKYGAAGIHVTPKNTEVTEKIGVYEAKQLSS